MDLDPTSFTIKEAAERLLPSNVWPGIKTDVPAWQPWSRPPKALPIDKEVTRQIERRIDGARAPHMRSREELAAMGIPCPYRHARFAATLAANDGTDRANDVRRARASGGPRLKGLAVQALDLADQIDAFLKEYRCWDLYGLELRPASRRSVDDQNARLRAVNDGFHKVQAAPEGLRALAMLASEKKERIAPSNADGDVWGQAFAERMGYAWRDLTGKDPSETSAYFLDFVEAAFDSLGNPRAHKGPWKDQVRTARERVEALPEWDRWDRCERRTDPPGVEVMPPGWFEERQKQRQRRFEAAVHALLDARTAEDETEARLRLLTGWSFLPETEDGQKTIARIREGRGPAKPQSV